MPFFQSDTAQIAYDVDSPPEHANQLLVLLNGYQRPRQDFRALRRRLRALSPKCAILTLDHRGSGETIDAQLTSRTPTLELLAADALSLTQKVMQEINVYQFSLMGISMGGMIAQIMAQQTSHLRKLILVSTAANAVQRLSHAIPLRDYFGKQFSSSHIAMVESFVKSVQKASLTDVAQSLSQWQRTAIQSFRGSNVLEKIMVPTLIISGDDDAVIPHHLSQEIARAIPNATLAIYPNVGHIILVEAAERLALDIADFLNSCDLEVY